MYRFLLSVVLLLTLPFARAQGNFEFTGKVKKTVIPFKLVNNLIILPVKLNGVPLNFMLDTGVEETILFSLEETDEIRFENTETIKLRGLGEQESVAGLKSTGNRLEFDGLSDLNHIVYIVVDQDFNFSSHIGIPVNGIIGYQFFKNNIVSIDYDRRKITVYRDQEKARARFGRKFKKMPISIELKKPYLTSMVVQDGSKIDAKLLIDTGSSDAIWLFKERSREIKLPAKFFEDYLGRGFSGDIYGKRGFIDGFHVSDFDFSNPLAAFPDSVSLQHVNMVDNRIGSVGGGILKRFTVVFDYPNHEIFLKKGSAFDEKFKYNMSGLELEHGGMEWIKEAVSTGKLDAGTEVDLATGKISSGFEYKFTLKPLYFVTSVRPGSPADEAGLKKGDAILTVNGRKTYYYTLQQINELLSSDEGKMIRIGAARDEKPFSTSFLLRAML